MSDTMNPDSWLTDKSDGRRFMIACATGLLLEAAALAILLPVMTHQSPPPAETQSIVKLSIIAPTPPAPLAPSPKPQPVTPPKQVTPPLPPPPPLPMAPPLPPAPPLPVAPNRPVIHHPPPRHLQPTPVPPPVAQVPQPPTPPMPAPPPAPVAPAQPSTGEIDLFQARMAEAVQRAATADYPEAAQMAHENGEVALSFVFQDGRVSNVAILQSSGFPMLDSAAMQAVRDARYPQQPADFAGRPHTVRVIVRFQTAPAEVDGD